MQAVFDRFITTELTTVDSAGQPITWPVTPYYRPGDPCIDVTTGLGYPKKANDAQANPLVSMLFSDPTGSGLKDPPTVLVQGSAEVDDKNLEANRERYARESAEKLPGAVRRLPPDPFRRFFSWYFTRIYIHVRPERIYVWPHGAPDAEPELYDAHMEEVRSGHSEEPERFHAGPEGGAGAWHPRMLELGRRYPTGVLAIVSPDGFPFSMRAPVHADEANRSICIDAPAEGAPLQPGLACLTAHLHEPGCRGWRTSRCAAIWSRATTAGGSSLTSSSAGSRHRRRRWRCCAPTPARRCGSAGPPSANWPAAADGSRCGIR